jgi:hypothetical protein
MSGKIFSLSFRERNPKEQEKMREKRNIGLEQHRNEYIKRQQLTYQEKENDFDCCFCCCSSSSKNSGCIAYFQISGESFGFSTRNKTCFLASKFRVCGVSFPFEEEEEDEEMDDSLEEEEGKEQATSAKISNFS